MNVEVYCRLCLKQDIWGSPLQIFVDNFTLPTKVFKLLNIDLKKSESLPQVMCHLCLAKIVYFDEFHEMAKTSTNLLNSLVSGKDAVSVDADSSRVLNESGLDSSNLPLEKPPVDVEDEQLSSLDQIESPLKNQSICAEIKPTEKREKQRTPVVGKKRSVKKKCPNCKFQTSSVMAFDNHVSKKYNCEQCSSSFCTQKGMKIHVRIVHQSCRNKQSIDSLCNKPDTEKPNDNSNSSEDSVSNKCLWCKECDKVFWNEQEFDKHKKEFHLTSDIQNSTSTKSPGNRSFNDENVSSKNKSKTVPVAESKKHSADVSTAKRKRQSNSLSEQFSCWKCGGEYQSREKLFVHTCISQNKEPEKHNSSSSLTSDDEIFSLFNKRKRTELLDYYTDSNNDDETDSRKVNDSGTEMDTVSSKQISSVVRENVNDISSVVVDSENHLDVLKESSETADNNSTLSDTSMDNPDEGTLNCEIDIEEDIKPLVDDGVEKIYDSTKTSDDYAFNIPSIKVEALTSFPLKTCNECGAGFTSMKDLVLHKRIHKLSN